MPREISDADGTVWTCIQAFAGLGNDLDKIEAAGWKEKTTKCTSSVRLPEEHSHSASSSPRPGGNWGRTDPCRHSRCTGSRRLFVGPWCLAGFGLKPPRQARLPVPRILSARGLEIDVLRQQVTWQGSVVILSPKEFDLLVFLARHAGKVATHRQILTAVWDRPKSTTPHYLRCASVRFDRKREPNP